MSRICELSGKKPMFGNNISHSHRKTRKKWVPNLQRKTFISETGEKITLRVCAKILKTIDRFGFDAVMRKFMKKGKIVIK